MHRPTLVGSNKYFTQHCNISCHIRKLAQYYMQHFPYSASCFLIFFLELLLCYMYTSPNLFFPSILFWFGHFDRSILTVGVRSVFEIWFEFGRGIEKWAACVAIVISGWFKSLWFTIFGREVERGARTHDFVNECKPFIRACRRLWKINVENGLWSLSFVNNFGYKFHVKKWFEKQQYSVALYLHTCYLHSL